MTVTIDLHLPDRDVYEQHELDIVYSIKPQRVLALVFEADKGMAVQLGTMVREGPVKEVQLRPWASDIGHEDAWFWALVCRYRADRVAVELPDGTPIQLIPGNEMNYAGEGYDGDLPRLVQWLEDFGKAWIEMEGHERYILQLPAPWSGWVGEDNQKAVEYWEACKAAGLEKYYKRAGCHAYAEGFNLWVKCAEIWEMSPDITEYNRVPAAVVMAALDPSQELPAASAFYFTSNWVCYENCTEDGYRKDDQFSLTRYPEIREEIRAANAMPQKESPVLETLSAIDVSSYQHATERQFIQDLRPDHVICRLYLPVELPSQDVSKDLVRVAREEGCSVGGYFWAYRSESPEKSIDEVINLCAEIGLVLPICWIDCETYGSSDPGPDAEWLRRAKVRADTYEMPLGIYTGIWWINEHFPGGMAAFNEFINWPLWIANYSQPPSLTFVPGVELAAHQYTSVPVDRSIIQTKYAVVAPTEEPLPENKYDELVRKLGAIYDEIGVLIGK